MEIDRAFKIRLYPTADQAALLAKTFGCKRFIWNAMLAERMACSLVIGITKLFMFNLFRMHCIW